MTDRADEIIATFQRIAGEGRGGPDAAERAFLRSCAPQDILEATETLSVVCSVSEELELAKLPDGLDSPLPPGLAGHRLRRKQGEARLRKLRGGRP